MGFETAAIKGDETKTFEALRRDAQLLRGDFLDAFARLEQAVLSYMGKTDVKAGTGQPFAQKLAKLQAARAKFRNPKRLDVRVAAIQQLLPVRADIVHSALQIAILFDGRAKAVKLCFQNASAADRAPLMIDREQFIGMTRRLNQLAYQFSQQRLKEATPAARAASSG